MIYSRPHIAENRATGAVTGVFWAPPFEGPNSWGSSGEFLRAYHAFAAAMDAEDARAKGSKAPRLPAWQTGEHPM